MLLIFNNNYSHLSKRDPPITTDAPSSESYSLRTILLGFLSVLALLILLSIIFFILFKRRRRRQLHRIHAHNDPKLKPLQLAPIIDDDHHQDSNFLGYKIDTRRLSHPTVLVSKPSGSKEKEETESDDQRSNRTKGLRPLSLSEISNNDVSEDDLSYLYNIGGLDGLLLGLHTNEKSGLVDIKENLKERDSLNPITLEEILKEQQKESPANDEEKEKNESHNLYQLNHNFDVSEDSPFYERIRIFGKNVLPEKKAKTIFELMLMAMKEQILIILTIAAVVSLALGIYEDYGPQNPNPDEAKIKWVEGVAIIVAIIIVVLVGSLNDWQKERQFRKLNAKKEDRNVKVTRNGKEMLLSVYKVLVGDILHLEPGDIIAVDGVLISSQNLRCDESAATGETKKNLKHIKFDPFVISGSKVLEGVGKYVVTGVGIYSFNGRTLMALRKDPENTPLQDKLNDLAEKIAKLGGTAAIIMLLTLLIKYFATFHPSDGAATIIESLVTIIISTVTVVVVAIPEGLPLAVTLALAYATTRMLKDNNLVRVLSACETMGNATTICSDKTGTLTQNKMTVVTGIIGSSVEFQRQGYKKNESLLKDPKSIENLRESLPTEILELLDESISVNSTAFQGDELVNGRNAFVGSKTETALLDFLLDLGLDDFNDLRSQANVVQLFPFSSERKAMGILIKKEDKWRFHIKGASEVLLSKSESVVDIATGDVIDLNNININNNNGSGDTSSGSSYNMRQLEQLIESFANDSLRTITVAYRDFEQWPPKDVTAVSEDGEVKYEYLAEKLTLIAIVGIEDPLRDGVKEAVADCKRAGVYVRMVTGDNMSTARSIAIQCGIFTPDNKDKDKTNPHDKDYNGGIIMEGPVFRKLSSDKMQRIIPRLQVLARSSPEDKRILVGKLKELGEIVAVTGDGTNDGPALKTADVGFSMGIAGTEVAKEASSIILMDDNFSSLVKAIMWGRCVNDSVKKFLQFQLTVNVTAVLLTFISAVSSNEEKAVLNAVQLLWVNLIMDTLAALALATDPPTKALLNRNPEPRNSPLINFRQIIIVTFGGAAFKTAPLNIIQWLICIGLGFLSIPIGFIIRLIPDEFLKKNIIKPLTPKLLIKMILSRSTRASTSNRTTSSSTTRKSSSMKPLTNSDYSSNTVAGGDNEGTFEEQEEVNNAFKKVESQLKVFKTLRGGRFKAHFGGNGVDNKQEKRSEGFHAAAMLPSLMSVSIVGVGKASTSSNNNSLGRKFRRNKNGNIDAIEVINGGG
nr:2948_t:CDS:2 [Entrophospora candida]